MISPAFSHRLHGAVLRLFYRILAPTHPRGWLDFHCLTESDATFSIHCHGMKRWNLPNVEIVGVPPDLGGFAHGILFDLTGYMKSQRAIAPDESFGGRLVSGEQIVPHQCTLRLVQREDEPLEKEFLRVVDRGEPPSAGFPKKLFAAHLLALSETRSYRARRLHLLQRSVAIYPGEPHVGADDEAEAPENPGNFFSWSSLGDALCDAGRIEEGLKSLRTAIERWPCGGRKNAGIIAEAIAQGRLPPPDLDPRSRFWSEVAAGFKDRQP